MNDDESVCVLASVSEADVVLQLAARARGGAEAQGAAQRQQERGARRGASAPQEAARAGATRQQAGEAEEGHDGGLQEADETHRCAQAPKGSRATRLAPFFFFLFFWGASTLVPSSYVRSRHAHVPPQIHIEAAAMLNFTEEEFGRVLQLGETSLAGQGL